MVPVRVVTADGRALRNDRIAGQQHEVIASRRARMPFTRVQVESGPQDSVNLTLEVTQNMLAMGINGDYDSAELTAKPSFIGENARLVLACGLIVSDTGAEALALGVKPEEVNRIIAFRRLSVNQVLWNYLYSDRATLRATLETADVGVGHKLSELKQDCSIKTFRDLVGELREPPDGVEKDDLETWADGDVEAFCAGLSGLMGFNFDIRDAGALLRPDMRLSVSSLSAKVGVARFRNKLCDWSLASIAALNLVAMDNDAFAAWLRAYLVGAGILHAEEVAPQRSLENEHVFTTRMPDETMYSNVMQVANSTEEKLYEISIALMAAHGMCHLAYDHTYKIDDQTSSARAQSYIKTLGTLASPDFLKIMAGKAELYLRTLCHPFGFPQGYIVARAMVERLPLALKLRVESGVSPPPAARITFVIVASTDMYGMPGLEVLSKPMSRLLEPVAQELRNVKADPTHYSQLAVYYGHESIRKIPAAVSEAATARLPILVAFALVTYVNDNIATGLARAQLIANVSREKAALIQVYQELWESYYGSLANNGFAAFVELILAGDKALLAASGTPAALEAPPAL